MSTEQSFQSRVNPWLIDCFGAEIASDKIERNHRFLEESLELAQACGCTASEAYQLVAYTFSRPVGETAQEAGGVMVTLAALCLAQGLDMAEAGEAELRRIWGKVETIRAKQAAKPKHSPLPEAPDPRDERILALEKSLVAAQWEVADLTSQRDEALRVRDLAREASNRDLEAKRAAEAECSRLRFVAVKFLNQAPMEGDYALLLLSLKGGGPTKDQRGMITSYGAARKRLFAAVAPSSEGAKP